jgi:hypothetical protein
MSRVGRSPVLVVATSSSDLHQPQESVAGGHAPDERPHRQRPPQKRLCLHPLWGSQSVLIDARDPQDSGGLGTTPFRSTRHERT